MPLFCSYDHVRQHPHWHQPKSPKWHQQPNQQGAIGVLMTLKGSHDIGVGAVIRRAPGGPRPEGLLTYFRLHNVVKVRSLYSRRPLLPLTTASPSQPARLGITMGTMTSTWGGCVPGSISSPESEEKGERPCSRREEGMNASRQFDSNSILNCPRGGNSVSGQKEPPKNISNPIIPFDSSLICHLYDKEKWISGLPTAQKHFTGDRSIH